MSNVNSDRRHISIARILTGREEPIGNFPESYHLLREITLDIRLDALNAKTPVAPDPTLGALTYRLLRYRNTLESIRSYEQDVIETGTIFTFGEIKGAATNGISWQRALSIFDEIVLVNGTDVTLFGLSLDFDPLRVRQESVTDTRILRTESRQAILYDRGQDRHE